MSMLVQRGHEIRVAGGRDLVPCNSDFATELMIRFAEILGFFSDAEYLDAMEIENDQFKNRIAEAIRRWKAAGVYLL